MKEPATGRPALSAAEASALAREHFALAPVRVEELPSERDRNFLLEDAGGSRRVLKLAHSGEDRAVLEAQNLLLAHVSNWNPAACPRVIRSRNGEEIVPLAGRCGPCLMRLLTYVPGTPLAKASPHTPELLRRVGRFFGRMDKCLLEFSHPAAGRELQWDLKHAGAVIERHLPGVADPAGRELVRGFLRACRTHVAPALPMLRQSVIHNDGNDYNILIAGGGGGEIGVIDFGDIVRTGTVFELAIASAYALLGKDDPVAAVAPLIAGYDEALPLSELEFDLLFHLIALRLATSVVLSAFQQQREPHVEYLSISSKPAWAALGKLRDIPPARAQQVWRTACGRPPPSAGPKAALLERRRRSLGYNLSVSYREPLKIVRGAGVYLYDEDGRAYVDLVNNVCHVGHVHPHVVRAGQEQMAVLNTNTRYLHERILEYAERLAAKFPAPLSVVYFVCSGSEANELALRMARARTGRRDVAVLDCAYHGNTSALIEMSPYKNEGKGGEGAPPHVHKVPLPDGYRGAFKGMGEETGAAYAEQVRQVMEAARTSGHEVAAFFAESLPGCGGQIVLPAGYLREAFRHVRAAGGVCVADEVQVGFGRVGTHFWGFETQGVVPDIVTLGKPMGNGHPLAGVVTTPEIAAAFNNGMEYFNTFGGNPVSCAIGMAVLEVIEGERLQEHAREVGAQLLAGLRRLREKHRLIGDVRGLGLYLGVELVRDRATLEPAGEEASTAIERMKDAGFLLSTDGPFHNVLKIKPPLVLSAADVSAFLAALDAVLVGMEKSS